MTRYLTILFVLSSILIAELTEKLPEGSLLHLSINMNGGQRLLLNDDSLWEIDPEDVEISRLWLSPFPLQINLGGSDLYPYLIINIRSQKQVKAKPVY